MLSLKVAFRLGKLHQFLRLFFCLESEVKGACKTNLLIEQRHTVKQSFIRSSTHSHINLTFSPAPRTLEEGLVNVAKATKMETKRSASRFFETTGCRKQLDILTSYRQKWEDRNRLKFQTDSILAHHHCFNIH